MTLKYKPLAWFSLIAPIALLLPKMAKAQDNDCTNLNRFSLSARVGFNMTARFKTLGTLTLPGQRFTPDGSPYNYDNGYVLTDVSGSAGGMTWNWGYDSSSQLPGNNTVLMNRTTASPNAASPNGLGSGDPNPGWELCYDRQLGSCGKWTYGIEAALNFTKVGFSDSSTFSGTGQQLTDVYAYTPGTTPPLAPYQGTFNGPGFLLGSSPISSSTSTVNTTIIGQRKFDSDIFGIRLGPYIEYPLTKRLDISVSGGFAAGLLLNSVSWNEAIYVNGVQAATSSGSGNNTGFVYGGYVSVDLNWQISKRWSATVGGQFEDVGVYHQTIGSREIELDMSKSIFVTIGGCFSF